jgi:short-subunit dehydrogenase
MTTTRKKTLAIFGAGTGLGASLATRFGREGYRVALVARRAGPLEDRVGALKAAGIEAAAFPPI